LILKIDGVKIKEPHEFNIERYDITKAERLASGKMVMDLIAKKKKFIFNYNVLSGKALQALLDLIDTDKMFHEFTYEENGVLKTTTVYSSPIKYQKFRTSMGWYWKNVSFSLIEQ
jgi:hypothetical protein